MITVCSGMGADVRVFNAASYEEALPLLNENPDMDLILLDLGLPGLSDVNALKAIRGAFPSVPVVVVSGNDDGGKVQQILSMGAQGYIPKSTHADLLIRALKLVLSGGVYIPPEILAQRATEGECAVCNGSHAEKNTDKANTLTTRQLEVLERLACGHSNKEIAQQLEMAEPTVRVHVAAIFKALNVTNRTQAVHAALVNGWVAVDRNG